MNTALLATPEPVLAVKQLRVCVKARHKNRVIVESVAFDLFAGEMLAIVGESGSGKSTIVKTILGLLPPQFEWKGGIELYGQALKRLPTKQLKALRGKRIGFVPQDPATSLDALQTVGHQFEEILLVHTRLSRQERAELLEKIFTQVGLKDPCDTAQRYPHELSGGMQQRVLIAMALALSPDILIADEATSALDASIQQQIMVLLQDLQRSGIAILFVTHDLPLAAYYATSVMVLKTGVVQEIGDAQTILRTPQSEYGKKLLKNIPSFWRPQYYKKLVLKQQDNIIDVKNISFRYQGQENLVIDQLSFCVARGTTHAVIGESGAGKSTLLKLLQGRLQPSDGSIHILGQEPSTLDDGARQTYGQVMQMVYQQPSLTFDPLHSVQAILEEPLLNYRKITKSERLLEIETILDAVHLPSSILTRRASDISGGQAQRLALARALLCRPQIMVMDEIVSALDVNVQSEILKLITIIQKKFNMTYIFVSHDLAVVRQVADTVTILRKGSVVQSGSIEEVFFDNPACYTKQLIKNVHY